MATLTDKLVGMVMILLAAGIFGYYTVWVMVLPFLEKEHFLHQYFPSRWLAVGLPVGAGVLLLSLIGAFVGVVLMREQSRKKAKKT